MPLCKQSRLRTQYEALKKKVDPSHDDHLGNHHHHLCFHTSHHAVHGRRVSQGIRRYGRRIALGWSVFEICPRSKRMREVS